MDTKMKMRLARAKRTAFGRFLCRLVGDTAGAVMMEYVVLGVLVVAFGGTIGSAFETMSKAIFSPKDAPNTAGSGRSTSDRAVGEGTQAQKTVTGMGQ